jgi:HD-GYP domain-containing protein (c-di-GMP phosphodiesterase class II)
MNSLLKGRSKLFWKIYGIVAITFLATVSFYFQNGFLEGYHAEIMMVSLLSVVFLSLLLYFDALKIMKSQQETIEGLMGIKLSLASLIDLKDSYTEGHSKHVRDLTRQFAEYLKLPSREIEKITTAAELHDIGKIGVPDSILKKNGKLSEEEFCEIKKHPLLGANSIKSLKGFENVATIIRNHHERYDGTGYPDGLSAEQIPLGSKILSLVDAYDAMAFGRSYRIAMQRNDILSTLQQGMGTQFDPNLTSAFIKFVQQKSNSHDYDPVCGMPIDRRNPLFQFTHKNQTYTFCSEICFKEFKRSPEKYSAEFQKNKPLAKS